MNNINIKKKTVKFVYKFAGIAAAVLAIIVGVVGYNHYFNVNKVDTVIEFDVNPSIEIQINRDDDVIDVKALNADGEKVIDDMDFDNVDLDVAVNAIIGSMLKNGYLTVSENSILVSVKSNDTKKGEQLQTDISKEIEEILSASQIDASVLTQEYASDKDIVKLAEDNNISEGKANLVSRIVEEGIKDSKGNVYTYEALAKLSVNELNLLLASKDVKLDNVQSTGAASEEAYIGKEKAKELAYSDAAVTSEEVSYVQAEFDCDDGKLVYEVEFGTTDKEYDYEIDAKTGDVIKREIENRDVDDIWDD